MLMTMTLHYSVCTGNFQPLTHAVLTTCKTIYKLLWELQTEIRLSSLCVIQESREDMNSKIVKYQNLLQVSRWSEELSGVKATSECQRRYCPFP